ncbi:hypothetical protein LWI29_024011 [Acer saccharum]|uniref:PHD finger protein ALFIN-LIKE n=1 Tax=Acer saccharum TaxID=4024 RepID=A0AA39SEG2_ACESA|nr:hypothetical protein LWI29_024011 [Acer saccharum]
MSPPPKEDDDSWEDEEEDDEQTCRACGDNYGADEFWICCDVCEKWFHGKCVKITPAKDEHIKVVKVPKLTRGKSLKPICLWIVTLLEVLRKRHEFGNK